ncbi:MAG TPA: hypothetical protein VGM88_17960 [Kofleriaceae bacterium]
MKVRKISKGTTEILVEYEPRGAIETDVEWFCSTLETMLARGSKFKVGQTFGMGWAVLVFVDAGKGVLGLQELDGSGIEGKFAKGVTRSLTQLRLQKSVAESFGLENQLDFATQRQTAICCKKLDADKAIVLSRDDPDEDSSGWFFSCTAKNHDHDDEANLKVETLYELSCEFPRLMPYLALPVGVMILVDGDKIKAEDGEGNKLAIKPGSLLDKMSK